jgi:VanZ family protein
MGLIALGSSSLLASERTDPWVLELLRHLAPWASPAALAGGNVALRKLGHLVEYGALAVLWYRALAPAPRVGWVAFILAAAYGGVDELWQGLQPSRTPAVSDVAIDASGALFALAAWEWPGSLAAATMGVAAWGLGVVAGLGCLMIALDLALGRPAADLGLAALGIGLTAAGLGSLARRARLRVSAGPRGPAPP